MARWRATVRGDCPGQVLTRLVQRSQIGDANAYHVVAGDRYWSIVENRRVRGGRTVQRHVL